MFIPFNKSTNNKSTNNYARKWYNDTVLPCIHPGDGSLWKNLAKNAPALAGVGITAVWMPPAYKGTSGIADTGYGVYDLFDLGEFDQKGTVRTKYGTRDEYTGAIKAVQDAGMQAYADIVFNHKLGGDKKEKFKATPFNPGNRNEPTGELQTIEAWTNFTFPGRKKKYSELEWHWWHFNAADYNALDDKNDAVFLFEGKEFNTSVDKEKGNFDFLMGCNLDFNNEDVRKELFYWGEWYLENTGIDGFRFDALKHVKSDFFLFWLDHLRKKSGRKLFAMGEYWSNNLAALENILDATNRTIMLFDAGLHFNFAAASKKGEQYDLRQIFDNSLVSIHPDLAVTLVSNHDTQPLESLESVVEEWFKPLAYSMILLRQSGYPCIFMADYYGAEYSGKARDGNDYDIKINSHKWMIDKFLYARKTFCFGDQYDYFDHSSCVGWTRTGDENHPGGMAVLLSNGEAGTKNMQTATPGTSYYDLTEHFDDEITTDGNGWAEFRCPAGSVSVWVPE